MTTLTLAKLAEIEAAASKATPIAWLCARTVDAFAAAGYETCEPSDYGAFPVYATLCDPQTVVALCNAYRERDALAALLKEFVACAVDLGNGEMFCKVEAKVVEQTRAAGLIE